MNKSKFRHMISHKQTIFCGSIVQRYCYCVRMIIVRKWSNLGAGSAFVQISAGLSALGTLSRLISPFHRDLECGGRPHQCVYPCRRQQDRPYSHRLQSGVTTNPYSSIIRYEVFELALSYEYLRQYQISTQGSWGSWESDWQEHPP